MVCRTLSILWLKLYGVVVLFFSSMFQRIKHFFGFGNTPQLPGQPVTQRKKTWGDKTQGIRRDRRRNTDKTGQNSPDKGSGRCQQECEKTTRLQADHSVHSCGKQASIIGQKGAKQHDARIFKKHIPSDSAPLLKA